MTIKDICKEIEVETYRGYSIRLPIKKTETDIYPYTDVSFLVYKNDKLIFTVHKDTDNIDAVINLINKQ